MTTLTVGKMMGELAVTSTTSNGTVVPRVGQRVRMHSTTWADGHQVPDFAYSPITHGTVILANHVTNSYEVLFDDGERMPMQRQSLTVIPLVFTECDDY